MKKLATTLLLLCVYALAEDPPAMAIQNARIVTVAGPAIARGTVVIRKGLIEAVGENVQVPADAVIVAGDGLTVYPGLIAPDQQRQGSGPDEQAGAPVREVHEPAVEAEYWAAP